MKMKKHITVLSLVMLLALFGCAANQPIDTPAPPAPIKADITITIKQAGDKTPIVASVDGEKKVMRSMEVHNPGLKLSQLSAISNDKMFVKIFSGLSVADVTRMWNDLIYLENETNLTDIEMFIDSPGGDAFSGLALADTIEKFQRKGFKFTAHATGIIASAAVPVFAVCDETRATEATIFMVHEAALWKWPGRETASDIRSQAALMNLLQTLYLNKLVRNSAEFDAKGKRIDFEYWEIMEGKTSWFSVKKAAEIGLLDFVNEMPAADYLKSLPPDKE
jgi:ATP-dependent protease ClpP protease subunit